MIIDCSRPYGDLGLEQADWEHIPIHNVSISDLILTQSTVEIARLLPLLELFNFDAIHVVNYQNKLYVVGGHHRLVISILQDKQHINAHIYNVV